MSEIWLLRRGGFSTGLEIGQNWRSIFFAPAAGYFPCISHIWARRRREKKRFGSVSPSETLKLLHFFGRAFGAHLYSISPWYIPCTNPFSARRRREKNGKLNSFSPLKTLNLLHFFGRAFSARLYSISPWYIPCTDPFSARRRREKMRLWSVFPL